MKSKLALKILNIIAEELPFVNTINAMEKIIDIESCPRDVVDKCIKIENDIRGDVVRRIW